jgi:hypothetical protein
VSFLVVGGKEGAARAAPGWLDAVARNDLALAAIVGFLAGQSRHRPKANFETEHTT